MYVAQVSNQLRETDDDGRVSEGSTHVEIYRVLILVAVVFTAVAKPTMTVG